jgi:hypothetical protein
MGPFASILPCPISCPLSTTADITTSDRDPSACRLPAPDLQTTGRAAAAPASWLRSIWRYATHVRRPKTRHIDCNEPARNLLPRYLVCFFVRSQFGEGSRAGTAGSRPATERWQDKSKRGLLVRSARELLSAHWVRTRCKRFLGSLSNVRSLRIPVSNFLMALSLSFLDAQCAQPDPQSKATDEHITTRPSHHHLKRRCRTSRRPSRLALRAPGSAGWRP